MKPFVTDEARKQQLALSLSTESILVFVLWYAVLGMTLTHTDHMIDGATVQTSLLIPTMRELVHASQVIDDAVASSTMVGCSIGSCCTLFVCVASRVLHMSVRGLSTCKKASSLFWLPDADGWQSG